MAVAASDTFSGEPGHCFSLVCLTILIYLRLRTCRVRIFRSPAVMGRDSIPECAAVSQRVKIRFTRQVSTERDISDDERPLSPTCGLKQTLRVKTKGVSLSGMSVQHISKFLHSIVSSLRKSRPHVTSVVIWKYLVSRRYVYP